jgi:hypothetical protein
MDTEGDVLSSSNSSDDKALTETVDPQTPSEASTVAAATSATAASVNPRVEVSAHTIARMMGIASATDLQLLEGRLDLLASRVATLMTKVDKVLVGLGALASTGDIGRIETQIASMKSILREAVDSIRVGQDAQRASDRESKEAQSRKLKEGIQSSSD